MRKLVATWARTSAVIVVLAGCAESVSEGASDNVADSEEPADVIAGVEQPTDTGAAAIGDLADDPPDVALPDVHAADAQSFTDIDDAMTDVRRDIETTHDASPGKTPLAGKEDITFSDLKLCTGMPSQMPYHFIDCGDGEVGLKATLDESYATDFTCEKICCAFWYSGCSGVVAQANLNYCALKDAPPHTPCDAPWQPNWSSACRCTL